MVGEFKPPFQSDVILDVYGNITQEKSPGHPFPNSKIINIASCFAHSLNGLIQTLSKAANQSKNGTELAAYNVLFQSYNIMMYTFSQERHITEITAQNETRYLGPQTHIALLKDAFELLLKLRKNWNTLSVLFPSFSNQVIVGPSEQLRITPMIDKQGSTGDEIELIEEGKHLS